MPDEIVGIFGPNGAGKSTLLKAVFGGTSVRVRQIHAARPGRHLVARRTELVARGVGYVPQIENVFPLLTIEENLRMGLFLAPRQWQERLAVVLELFPPLSGYLKTRAGNLSGGERQMVALGPRAHDESQHSAAGRAIGRPVAADAGRGLRVHPEDQTAGRRHASSSSRTPVAAWRSATAATCSIRAETPTPTPAPGCCTTRA